MECWYKKIEFPNNYDPIIDNYLELHEQIENNIFWYDEIRKVRKDSAKRLQLAMNELPLPSAFDEAAKAIRQIIRDKKRSKLNYENEIAFLYKLACVRSFMLDYAKYLKQPGYNVMLYIPGAQLFKLKTDYNEIGVEKLQLLTKTDKAQIIKLWGNSINQKTMNEIYVELWNQVEMEIIKIEERKISKIFTK